MQGKALIALFLACFTVQTNASSYYNEFRYTDSMEVSVSFADSSAQFLPTQEQIDMLGDLSKAAMVVISGRTSTSTASAKDELLALARAQSARRWLVRSGVSPLKIMINYVSAGDFLTENDTPQGKFINQRVDIEAIYTFDNW